MTEPAAAVPGGSRRLLRSSAVVGVGTALSRITGFGRVAAIAYALGATKVAGVYAYANETPNILYELLLGGILTATLLPLFVKQFQDRDEEATNALVTVGVVALLGATVVGILLAPWIVRIYTLQVSGPSAADQRELATAWLRCFMPQILFYGVTAIATGLLNARRRFAAAAFAPILNNVVVIAIFLSLPRLVSGPITLDRVLNDTQLLLWIGLGTTAGIAAMALVLWPAIVRAGVRLRPVFAWRHAAVRTMFRLSGWTVGYVIANQIALWVVLVLANGKSSGAFIYLSAYAFFQLPHGLFAVSITTAIQPEFASAYVSGNLLGLRYRFARGLRLIVTLMVPAAALYVGLTQPIVAALLQRGAFDATATTRVANTLLMFAFGLPAFSVYLYTQRAFYAMQDTRTPFLVNCFENAANIAGALVLYPLLGLPGLALSFTIAYSLAALLTLAIMSRRLGGLRGRQVGSTFARVLVVAAVVAAVTWLVANQIGYATPNEAILACAVAGTAGVVVAIAGLWAMRIHEYTDLRDAFRRGAGRGAVVSR
ncbi:MAG: murein biosynthesis integral membrane protein MurJ [Acidimicrobiia bacterium]